MAFVLYLWWKGEMYVHHFALHVSKNATCVLTMRLCLEFCKDASMSFANCVLLCENCSRYWQKGEEFWEIIQAIGKVVQPVGVCVLAIEKNCNSLLSYFLVAKDRLCRYLSIYIYLYIYRV